MVEVPMWRILVSGGVLVIAAVGCHHAVEINAKQPIPVGSRWTATLATPDALRGAVQIHGSAWMAPPAVGDTGRALIEIQIANAAPGGVHPGAYTKVPAATIAGSTGRVRPIRRSRSAVMAPPPAKPNRRFPCRNRVNTSSRCWPRKTTPGQSLRAATWPRPVVDATTLRLAKTRPSAPEFFRVHALVAPRYPTPDHPLDRALQSLTPPDTRPVPGAVSRV